MQKKFVVVLLMFAAAWSAQTSWAASKDSGLSAEEAREVLNPVIPNAKIIHVKRSPVAGLWEIGVDAGGRKMIIYLDHARKHIISPATGGNIVSLKTRTNLTQESFQKINKVDVSKIPLKDALVMGDKSAKHKVIVFDDPD